MDRRPWPTQARVVGGVLATVLTAALLCVPELREQPSPAATPESPVAQAAGADLPELPAPVPVPGPVGALPAEPPVPAAEAPSGASLPARTAWRPQPVPAAPPPAPHLAERAREALDALRYPWQELGYGIRFQAWDGGQLLGATDSATRTITVFVRRGQSDHSLRVTLAHELGHALDFVTGGDGQRRRYLELRGIPPGTAWFPCDGCSDYASPAGDWAEVFALWLAGPGDFRSELAGPPDEATLREIAKLFGPPSSRPAAAPAPPPRSPEPSPSPSPSPTRRPLIPLVP